ncbi:MAG: NADH-quinone oxidoreductase subunit C [Actinomycetales bacterium]|nr:NADH-quinone oxidoreductase subunit C [Actinomycetales bacterium]
MTRLHPTPSHEIAAADLHGAVAELLGEGWRLALVAGHDDPDALRVVQLWLRPVGERREIVVRVSHEDPRLPTLADVSFPAGRFERELLDLFGIHPEGHPMPQRLVRHAHWPNGWHPMRRDAAADPVFDDDLGSFPFLQVAGDGVYEIPVGPIHAGLIEPGHFRFSVVGETILRMKARLWFVHRGMERLFQGRTPEAAIELAERVSGDTAVGHTLAFVQAVEDALAVKVDPETAARRALLLELERLYNHVSDLGAMANDVGFGIPHIHAQRLRESLLRHNAALTGHRLLRGAIGVGTARLQCEPDLSLIASVAAEVVELAALTLGHSVVLDRFTRTGALPAEQARAIGVLGYVARASGVSIDARADHPSADLGPDFVPITETSADVRARYAVRAREFASSALLVPRLTRLAAAGGLGRSETQPGPGRSLPEVDPRGGEARPTAAEPRRPVGGPCAGVGVVEAWRGTLCHRVELAEDGTLSRVKIVDPSFFSWPAMPVALADTIVPDFPLVNKSFNQSYAGNDL